MPSAQQTVITDEAYAIPTVASWHTVCPKVFFINKGYFTAFLLECKAEILSLYFIIVLTLYSDGVPGKAGGTVS